MRISRFTVENEIHYGVVQGEGEDQVVVPIAGDPFYNGIQPIEGASWKVQDVRLLAPVIPRSKIVCVGRNYADHAAEMGNELPTSPMLFFKPNTSVVGPGDPVTLPSWTERVSYEAELAVVIGRICKDVPAEKADEVVFGYTAANDLTARDAQETDGQWARAKGFDGSCPLGPWIETELDPSDLRIASRVDGQTKQDSSTAQMVFSVAEIIAYASAAFTLLPGDVILTGTPAGVGQVDEGDRIEVEVEGIGTLATVLRR
ncbi:fumarylacetoacetate hydrolase family protein [Kocuria palustris]|jgi:2-keto-4-pentenoate hydratase/2-oxohepta-3-ene-1,7-dioic acid hydratase in catechol pathway|uniref:fumarylacetoacetate hydrolase family protein n=1 Tax=Kocuria palustris TaxID=71999 RepID=UPI00077B7AD0|nr:fumarylacetoacetate hydrolase family protein [Kocuria palustris]MDN5573657.1 fumarylacetoacetate hydrolase family protein [Micrococcales bacterium]MBN6752217.1 fumarylacetoacetate hydrolase family protein [Kocuria palustris]MBN6757172.1 fumarylacetoacetate hydrolase family protein [Kocuria palustris]MBN6762200.1 fumarylacetoacetate hydrolase family protein [Kocuria palustris]MBN6781682.1 fumarylacetoacetate hydrolase family protein [Kocuria palustris]